MAAAVGLGLLALLVLLDRHVEGRFQNAHIERPSVVFARPFEIVPRLHVEGSGLLEGLERMGYRRVRGANVAAGEYALHRSRLVVGRRSFPRNGNKLSGVVEADLDWGGRVLRLRDDEGQPVASVRLEPEVLARFYSPQWQDRRFVELTEFPPRLVQAVLVVEDRRFYDHWGLDVRRIGGAFFANVRAGRITQGGSTITQQLVKNLYLWPERVLVRKLVEAAIALRIEWGHGKDEILEAYLNHIYLGQHGPAGIYGLGEAARHYFGKDVADLSLAQCALLAGLIRAPGVYSPHQHPESALARRNLVLGLMLEQEWIPSEEHAAAVSAPLGARRKPEFELPAPYVAAYVREQLPSTYGDRLETRGLSIHTTIDPHLQRLAARSVREELERLERQHPELLDEGAPLEAALVAMAPRTGEILALVGGRDFERSQFNRVTQALRQPGSAFKPVVALTALIPPSEEDPPAFTLASLLDDEPLTIEDPNGDPTGDWAPANYDGEFRGKVTLRTAIEDSLNVPIARLGIELGPDRVIETARRLGMQRPLRAVPSLSLGAFEVSLLELTRMYAVFASAGLRSDTRVISSVSGPEGEPLHHANGSAVRVLSEAEAYLVTSVLRGAVDRGTGRSLRALGYRGPAAGKTGTTNDHRDAWFMGYTPDIAIGVWVGFDDPRSVGLTGASAALPIFASFISQLGSRWTASEFSRPAGVERVRVNVDSGLRAGFGCRGSPEHFLAGTAPTEYCGRRVGEALEWLGELFEFEGRRR